MSALPVRIELPALPPSGKEGPIPRDIVNQIAWDIGKTVAHHVATMYPDAVKATGQSMLLSLRNCTYNEIMAALQTTDVVEIAERLKERKRHRREIAAAYRKLRA